MFHFFPTADLNCSVFPTELFSRHVEYFWFYYRSWKHHGNSGGFAGKIVIHHIGDTGRSFFFFPNFTTVPLCRHSLSHVVLNFAICGLHPGCHSLFCLCHPPCKHTLVSPSRWIPSIWVSWSFSEQLGWSSCWGRATPSAFSCGPSCNPSRCDISTTTLFFPSSLKDEHVFQRAALICSLLSFLWQALPYVCLLIAMLFFIYAIIGMQVHILNYNTNKDMCWHKYFFCCFSLKFTIIQQIFFLNILKNHC